ncbi:hypothetical protein SOVF_199440 [Spinacia oleracea]|nr:hypothetical protein SOVF_199440 [Spinacia oleracea]
MWLCRQSVTDNRSFTKQDQQNGGHLQRPPHMTGTSSTTTVDRNGGGGSNKPPTWVERSKLHCGGSNKPPTKKRPITQAKFMFFPSNFMSKHLVMQAMAKSLSRSK